MLQRVLKRKEWFLPGLLFLVAAAGAAIWGCGSGGYDTPTTTSTPALISPETLKAWMDGGKVNGEGYDRVVILDVTAPGTYNAGHIPGAQLVNNPTEIFQTRIEGLAPSVNMVPDGSHMDALIRKLGIDANTTIVFTSSNILYAARGYFTFRYWGFPKERLKVLDGIYTAWNATYPGALDNVAPVVTPSTYSVRNLGALNAGLRVSLGEMMVVAADTDPRTVIVDARSGDLAGSYAGVPGSTAGVFPPSSPADYVVFEGHMKGAKALNYSTLMASGRFLPADNLVTMFGAIGVDSTKTAYVHCRTGVIASVEFFVLDGILGWNTVLYDGSWSQWGQMSGNSSKGGVLASSSAWRTDVSAYSDLVVYNLDNALLIETLVNDPLAVLMYTTVTDPSANQIEKEDAEYMTGGGGTSGGGTTPGGGSGGGC